MAFNPHRIWMPTIVNENKKTDAIMEKFKRRVLAKNCEIIAISKVGVSPHHSC